jgi:hypothetical protein
MVGARAIKKFPREFKKNQLESIDYKFFLIVFVSLSIHLVGIVIFKSIHSFRLQSKTIDQIQKHYANIVLDREHSPVESGELDNYPAVLSEELLQQQNLSVLQAGEGAPGSGAGPLPDAYSGAYANATAEARLPTLREMSDRRLREGGARLGKASNTAGAVRKIGFLGVLTAGSGYVPEEYISAITDYGDFENSRLGKALSALDAASVVRGPDGGGWKNERGGMTEALGARAQRGTRRVQRALTIDDLIGEVAPAGRVEFQRTKSNTNFEATGENVQLKAALSSAAEAGKPMRRKPSAVQAVINRHRPAITDCYKGLLRQNPSLKGKVQIRFAIDPNGRVSWAELVNSSFSDESLHSCVLSRIRQWNDFGFGDPAGPDEVYRQSFTFGY